MSCKEMIEKLKQQASEQYKMNVVKMGIPEECSLGVSTTVVRTLAKGVKKSNELAFELWDTTYHEARLLAVLLFQVKELTKQDIEKLMTDVISWDLCDHLCKNLIIKRNDYQDYIFEWITSSHIYKKRAAFTLIASSVIHDKKLTNEKVDDYLDLITRYSESHQEHVKKAVSWALREIGKKDFDYNEKALVVAHELLESGNATQKWIAKDVLKEIEHVVKVEGRGRLISTKTKMGSE